MLRTIRLTLAIVFFAFVTLLFLDFTGTLHGWMGWMAKIQFLPALLALNAGVVLLLVALTLLFGRVYCSVICPLGVFQDVISRFAGKRKKNRFRYSPARKWLRYAMLAVFAVALVAGVRFHAVASLLEPYSSYGRIASNLFAPVYQWGNNLLAYLAERADSYAFYETEVWMKSLPTFIIASLTFVVLIILAWRGGRTYCNTICPVGTVLGFLSGYSLFKPVIDTEKCNGCGLCARNCKASCINSKTHEIDYSRCVACMDCLDKCRQGAITYTRRRHKADAAKISARNQTQCTTTSTGPADDTRRIPLGNGSIGHYRRSKGAREESRRRTGRHRRQEDTRTCRRHYSSGVVERTQLCTTLYGLPAMRCGVSQPGAAPLFRPDTADAAGNVLRARLLPSRMYQVFGSLSGRCYPADNESRQIGHPDRSCRMDKGELHLHHR